MFPTAASLNAVLFGANLVIKGCRFQKVLLLSFPGNTPHQELHD